MSKVTPIKPRRPVVSRDTLNAQVEHLTEICAGRVELLEDLPYVFAWLSEIVPPARRNELSHSIWYVTHVLDLTQPEPAGGFDLRDGPVRALHGRGREVKDY